MILKSGTKDCLCSVSHTGTEPEREDTGSAGIIESVEFGRGRTSKEQENDSKSLTIFLIYYILEPIGTGKQFQYPVHLEECLAKKHNEGKAVLVNQQGRSKSKS